MFILNRVSVKVFKSVHVLDKNCGLGMLRQRMQLLAPAAYDEPNERVQHSTIMFRWTELAQQQPVEKNN